MAQSAACPLPKPPKGRENSKKVWFFPYKSKNDGLQEKTYRPSHLVRMTGLEPAHYIIQEPKSCVSANFTTSAKTSLL